MRKIKDSETISLDKTIKTIFYFSFFIYLVWLKERIDMVAHMSGSQQRPQKPSTIQQKTIKAIVKSSTKEVQKQIKSQTKAVIKQYTATAINKISNHADSVFTKINNWQGVGKSFKSTNKIFAFILNSLAIGISATIGLVIRDNLTNSNIALFKKYGWLKYVLSGMGSLLSAFSTYMLLLILFGFGGGMLVHRPNH